MEKNAKEKRRHFASFRIAGFGYYDGCMAMEHLAMGSKLILKREENNKFDPHAVAIYYKDMKLGFIPQEKNEVICNLLDMGYSDIFEARVQRLSPDMHPEKQIAVILYLLNRETVEELSSPNQPSPFR